MFGWIKGTQCGIHDPLLTFGSWSNSGVKTFSSIWNNLWSFSCMKHDKNNNGPLTAVPSVSLTVILNCPSFYRWALYVWCHIMTSSSEKIMCKIASVLLVSFYFPSGSHEHCLFSLTLIGQDWSHDQNNLPCSFQLNCLHQVVLFI